MASSPATVMGQRCVIDRVCGSWSLLSIDSRNGKAICAIVEVGGRHLQLRRVGREYVSGNHGVRSRVGRSCHALDFFPKSTLERSHVVECGDDLHSV